MDIEASLRDFFELIGWYLKGVGIFAIVLLVVRMGPDRIRKEGRVYLRGPLPERFIGPFSKGELVSYLFQCLVGPMAIFFILPCMDRGIPENWVIGFMVIYALLVLGLIPFFIEKKVDHWY